MYAELTRIKCSRCHKERDLSCFTNNRSAKTGKDCYCRPCKSSMKKEDYIKNRDRIKQQVHESYKRNKAKCIARALKYRTENREKVLAQKRFSKLGITREQYETMRTKQNAKCEICGKHESESRFRLSADHCHTTGKFRSLLCGFCNTGIGLFKEDLSLLKKAIEYLKKHQK